MTRRRDAGSRELLVPFSTGQPHPRLVGACGACAAPPMTCATCPPKALRLGFRPEPAPAAPPGPPVLPRGGIQAAPAAAGEPFHVLMVKAANSGPETSGLKARLAGSALEEEPLAPAAILFMRPADSLAGFQKGTRRHRR